MTGLKQSDFRILEDGAEQQIVSFEERKPSVPAAEPLPPLPVNTFSNLPDPKASGPLNLILYDLLNTAPEYRHYAHDQLMAFLKTRPPGQYAIFVLGNRLELLQGFTAGEDAVLAAANGRKATTQPNHVDAAPGKDTPGVSDKAAATADPLDTVDAQTTQLLAQMESNERGFRPDQQAEVTVDAFAAIAKFLMTLPGRKNLLWLSGSFPLPVLPETSDANADQSARNYTDAQKKVADLLNVSHTAVHAVDVRGPMNNANGLKQAFSKAIVEGSDYYTAAYEPSNKKLDGRLRKIRVDVDRNGYEVSYRRSYFADDLAGMARDVDSLGEALELGTPNIPDLQFVTHVSAGKPATGTPEQLAAIAKFQGLPELKPIEVQRILVDFAVLARHLTMIPAEDGGQKIFIEFAALAYGPDGQRLNGWRAPVRNTLTPHLVKFAEKNGYRFRLPLDVPATVRYLRVGVRDNLSGRVGVVELPLPLPPEPGAQ